MKFVEVYYLGDGVVAGLVPATSRRYCFLSAGIVSFQSIRSHIVSLIAIALHIQQFHRPKGFSKT